MKKNYTWDNMCMAAQRASEEENQIFINGSSLLMEVQNSSARTGCREAKIEKTIK